MIKVKYGGWIESWVNDELHHMLEWKNFIGQWLRSNSSVKKHILPIYKGGVSWRFKKNSQYFFLIQHNMEPRQQVQVSRSAGATLIANMEELFNIL